ncbi:MAG: hypothetical protein ACRDJ1_12535 [Actinomycetota bacterium]
MATAAKILILGGLGSLLASFGMALVLAQERTKDPEADQTRLLQVHIVSLWEGFMLFGLVWAVVLSDLSAGVENLAAVLLVTAAAIQIVSNTLAWRQRLVNLFAPPRGFIYKLGATQAVLALVGLVILIIGVVGGL